MKELLFRTFPKSCISCKRAGCSLCSNCEKELIKINIQSCINCDRYSLSGATHMACKTQYSPNKTLSMFKHTKTARNIINNSKGSPFAYNNVQELLKTKHAEEIIKNAITNADIIVPIPQSQNIFSKRLVSLPTTIAENIGGRYNIPISKALTKNLFTHKLQKKLNKRDRFINTKRSININKRHLNEISNRNLLLVDDTTVTGATLMSASKMLIKNGARSITCLTITKDILER